MAGLLSGYMYPFGPQEREPSSLSDSMNPEYGVPELLKMYMDLFAGSAPRFSEPDKDFNRMNTRDAMLAAGAGMLQGRDLLEGMGLGGQAFQQTRRSGLEREQGRLDLRAREDALHENRRTNAMARMMSAVRPRGGGNGEQYESLIDEALASLDPESADLAIAAIEAGEVNQAMKMIREGSELPEQDQFIPKTPEEIEEEVELKRRIYEAQLMVAQKHGLRPPDPGGSLRQGPEGQTQFIPDDPTQGAQDVPNTMPDIWNAKRVSDALEDPGSRHELIQMLGLLDSMSPEDRAAYNKDLFVSEDVPYKDPTYELIRRYVRENLFPGSAAPISQTQLVYYLLSLLTGEPSEAPVSYSDEDLAGQLQR